MVDTTNVKVLLGSAPTPAEAQSIRRIFARVGLEAAAQGRPFGGPPSVSTFLIVVSVHLTAFLDHFVTLNESGPMALLDVIEQLHTTHAQAEGWGRAYQVRLEDSSHCGLSVTIPHQANSATFAALLGVDLSVFGQATPRSSIEWNSRINRWTCRFGAVPETIDRRLPSRRANATTPDVQPLALDADYNSRLWHLIALEADSPVTWLRASVVLRRASGCSTAAVSRDLLMSERRVRSIIANFNKDGFESLRAGYSGGEPVQLSPAERREAMAIAARAPEEFGASDQSWTSRSLVDFLVREGVVEDADPDFLESFGSDATTMAPL